MSKITLSSIYRKKSFPQKSLPSFFIITQQYATNYKTYYKNERFHKPYDNIGKGNPAIRPKQPLGPDGKNADMRYKEGNNRRYKEFFVNNYVNVNKELLEDIPQWLKGLRLNKYKDCFNGMKWQEIIQFDDEKLQKLGVATVGARGRLLRAFELAKNCISADKK